MASKDFIGINEDSLNIDFLDSKIGENEGNIVRTNSFYKVLISDDEEEVHKMTKLVLKSFEMEGARLKFYDTYSGKETMEFLDKNHDIAIILLDVVMEDDDAGLRVVKYLRETLKNNITRIVLRTGQPGKAPENKIIVEYEIDDYKSKTELTIQKLFSTMYVCLRAHKNIKSLNRQKVGLSKVINASQDLFKYHSFTEFINGMLIQVMSLYDVDVDTIYIRDEDRVFDGMAFIQIMDSAKILAATGKYEHLIGKPLDFSSCHEDIRKIVKQIQESREDELVLRQGDFLAIYKQSSDKLIKNYIILETKVNSDNIEIIKIFLNNFSLAVDNYMINMNAHDTQNEIIYRITEVVENRSNSTGSHSRRVSEITRILAEKLGYNDEQVETISMASVMHDIGKIAIDDSILLKPGKLSMDEFNSMKKHTTTGYNILKDSKFPLLKIAADIAHYHHERYDGNGYPDGKKGGEIPKECEIVAVADVFEALVSKRCYKEPWSREKVIQYFKESRGTQFSPDVVEALLCKEEEVFNLIMTLPE
ncbi:HD domain-containing phosphohydrolase [Clostridium sp.]|uniref:HD domain-containing phosphohydrolase n=1 Tax=Clostridium sp. TaxID=1506 RepID=UPI001A480429|nr:HD domain-containing phosphohydrolase [Clostridium sp.]MBK5236719.1 DUF3369 domain-containing protein [Clostridium sp.]